MNSFFLYVPINRTLIACFLGLTVGILYFCNLFEKCGYKSRPLHRWIGILLLTFLVSIPNEYFISASDVLIKKTIDCVNENKNIRLRMYMKDELKRRNVREYKVERVYEQCLNDKMEVELLKKRKAQSQTLF